MLKPLFILEVATKTYKTAWAQKRKSGGTPNTPNTPGRKAKGKDGGGGGGGGERDRDGGGDGGNATDDEACLNAEDGKGDGA